MRYENSIFSLCKIKYHKIFHFTNHGNLKFKFISSKNFPLVLSLLKVEFLLHQKIVLSMLDTTNRFIEQRRWLSHATNFEGDNWKLLQQCPLGVTQGYSNIWPSSDTICYKIELSLRQNIDLLMSNTTTRFIEHMR